MAGETEKRWWKNYQQLKEIWEKTKSVKIPIEQKALRSWLANQRTSYRVGRMSGERIEALEAIGVRLQSRNMSWQKHYEAVKSIKEHTGNLDLPLAHPHGAWLQEQRQAHMKGTLPAERLNLLQLLGTDWSGQSAEQEDEQWEEMWEGLKTIFHQTGNANVPRTHETHGAWLHEQRLAYQHGLLAPDRRQALAALNIRWTIRTGK